MSEAVRPDDPGFCRTCGSRAEFATVEGKRRPRCLTCGHVEYLDPKLAAAVFIVRNGTILLGKRGPGTRAPGKWSFPAGFVERGELVERAAAREAREETGLDVAVGPLLGLFSEEQEPVVLAVFEAEIISGTATAADDLTELDWFAFDRLPELAFPRDAQIVADWLNRTPDPKYQDIEGAQEAQGAQEEHDRRLDLLRRQQTAPAETSPN